MRTRTKSPRIDRKIRPGQPVPGSKTGRPIMVALHLLSQRWVLRIIWELRGEAIGFRDLRGRCEQMSPDTLSTRLTELAEAGIVAHDPSGDWTLTPLGQQLGPALKELQRWSDNWAREFAGKKLKAQSD